MKVKLGILEENEWLLQYTKFEAWSRSMGGFRSPQIFEIWRKIHVFRGVNERVCKGHIAMKMKGILEEGGELSCRRYSSDSLVAAIPYRRHLAC